MCSNQYRDTEGVRVQKITQERTEQGGRREGENEGGDSRLEDIQNN